MKGFDAVVFPRDGEPTLFCLEASAEDAARAAWTPDVRLVEGYRADDPRPPVLRTLERAADAAREHGVVGLELSLGTQASDRMVGEPTTYTKGWFDAFPGRRRRDAVLLAAARAIKTPQEIERMRLANDIAAAAMDHVVGVDPPGHDRGADRLGVARLRPRRGHGLGGEGRPRARLLARLGRAGDQDVHGDEQPAGARGRADALRDLGLRGRLLVRPHEERRRRRAHRALPRARGAA